ncbi:MAG: hypothetical protein R3231_07685 [bacterium]|nr:hypothetical protein [bacterium]
MAERISDNRKGESMSCPKCGASRMLKDNPVYFNHHNHEGDHLYLDELYRCQICGKVVFQGQKMESTPKRFVKGQIVTGGYDTL